MVLGQILKVGSVVFKYRRQIYSVLTAQDRYIDKAMKAGRYGLQARRGVRHGALGGSLIGTLITDPTQEIIDGVPQRNGTSPNQQYKKRGGQQRYSTGYNKYKYSSTGVRYKKCYPRRSKRSGYR